MLRNRELMLMWTSLLDAPARSSGRNLGPCRAGGEADRDWRRLAGPRGLAAEELMEGSIDLRGCRTANGLVFRSIDRRSQW